jgi:hypothetical protein
MSYTLCDDIIEVVGQEVLKIREQHKRYRMVVYWMKDMIRDARDRPSRQLIDDHDNTFISDFKECILEDSEKVDFICATWGWSRAYGNFGYRQGRLQIQMSRSWDGRVQREINTHWYPEGEISQIEKIRSEIYDDDDY